MIRRLEQQFEPEKVQRIRELARLFQSLPLQRGAARYFISEIARCLDAGLILAALEVATSLLELFVRDLLIAARFEDNIAQRGLRSHQLLDQVEREIEDVERLHFRGMVDELVDRRIIDQPDDDAIRDLYKTVRIPIHHGLTRRFVRLSSDIHEDDPLAPLSLGRPGRFHRFEEAIEEDSISHLSTIVNFIGRYSEGAD